MLRSAAVIVVCTCSGEGKQPLHPRALRPRLAKRDVEGRRAGGVRVLHLRREQRAIACFPRKVIDFPPPPYTLVRRGGEDSMCGRRCVDLRHAQEPPLMLCVLFEGAFRPLHFVLAANAVTCRPRHSAEMFRTRVNAETI